MMVKHLDYINSSTVCHFHTGWSNLSFAFAYKTWALLLRHHSKDKVGKFGKLETGHGQLKFHSQLSKLFVFEGKQVS